MTRLVLALTAVAAILVSSCVAVAAGAVAGFVVARETTPEEESATVARDVERVWPEVQDAMRALSTTLVEVSDPPRRVRGEVDGAEITVEVRGLGPARTEISVRAEKLYVPRPSTARGVLDEILRRLER